jgi:hypothetical protein
MPIHVKIKIPTPAALGDAEDRFQVVSHGSSMDDSIGQRKPPNVVG